MRQAEPRNKWGRARFGDFFHIKHGYAFKGAFFSDSGPYVLLTPGNFRDEGGFKLKGAKEKYYTGEVPIGYILSKDDLLVAMTEQAEGLLGSSALIPQSGVYLHNQRLGLISELDESQLTKKYLYYLFNSPDVRTQIRATANGAKVRHTSPSRIYEVEFALPSLPTQRRIAAILSAYDDLIENNTRRIAILEEMARRLYEEWFVHFRFPDHEGVKMVESEIGNVPEGWEVKTVEGTFEVMGGGTPSKAMEEYWQGGEFNWYAPTDLTKSGNIFMDASATRITELGLRKSSARLFPPFSVMMTSRATLGVIAINTTEACTNQGFITCLPNDHFPIYTLYHWLKANVDQFVSLGTGATFKEITKGVFKKIRLFVPPALAIGRFESAVSPVMGLVLCLQRKNANLRAQRDLLLPKLTSGEIDVSQICRSSIEVAAE